MFSAYMHISTGLTFRDVIIDTTEYRDGCYIATVVVCPSERVDIYKYTFMPLLYVERYSLSKLFFSVLGSVILRPLPHRPAS